MTSSNELTPQRLSRLFRPRRVVVVGASDKSYFSQNLVDNLLRFGFGERMHLVNRRSPIAHGLPTVPNVADIGAEIDLAFMMVPQAVTLEALSEVAAAGVRNAVVMSAGYGEAGATGRQAQDELVAHAASLGMVVLGPNMLGFANFVDRAPVTTIRNLPQRGGDVALLSQSGASSSAMLEFATMAGVDLSYLVTLGNEAMVTAGHALDFLVDDDATKVVAIFLETVRSPRVFRSAARRALAADKPVVVLKAGRSELAARTAAAHTGALVGDDATVDAVFRDLGVIRVDTIEDLLVTAGAAARLGRLPRTGVGVVSISGGACDIIADLADAGGLTLPALAPNTVEELTSVMPAYGSVQNPLDVTGAAVIDTALNTACIEAVGNDPSVGVVLAVNRLPWQEHEKPFVGQGFIDAIGKGAVQSSAPVVFVNQVMQPVTDTTRDALRRGGLDYAICGLGYAVTAVRNVCWWSAQHPTAPARRTEVTLPAPGQRAEPWSEHRARALLESAGVPVIPSVLATTAEEAVAAAESFGGPVAVKLVSPQVLHKSDIGGVRLGVEGAAEVRAAFEAVTAAGSGVRGAVIEGALVSPMREDALELLVGVARDPQWGPILAVALGGVFVEVLRDAALAPLPVSPDRARELLGRLRGSHVLRGVRGAPGADLEQVVAAVARVADLAYALGDALESLEVNPLRVGGSVVEALDAVVTWREPDGTTEEHA